MLLWHCSGKGQERTPMLVMYGVYIVVTVRC